ncbi:MAG TPA: hypothetical protein VFB12_03455 [Ktedonobacteraceae bacterium]|nr:hypothetical protein [Ktedonobacteraceae bacterium]
MEPLDSDYDVIRQPRETNPRARFNWLYVLPVFGVIWLLFLAGAAIFQWPIDGVVDPVMMLMVVFFFIMVGLLFWALAPKQNRA